MGLWFDSSDSNLRPSDLLKMSKAKIHAKMMKWHFRPLIGFVKLWLGVHRTPVINLGFVSFCYFFVGLLWKLWDYVRSLWSNQFGFGGIDVQTELGYQPWSMGRSMNRRSRAPIWLIWFVGFYLFILYIIIFFLSWLVGFFSYFSCCGWWWFGSIAIDFFLVQRWMWMWRFFFLFFLCCCLWLRWIWLVASGGDCGWMWWLWYGWVDAVASGVKNNWVERERERERERE